MGLRAVGGTRAPESHGAIRTAPLGSAQVRKLHSRTFEYSALGGDDVKLHSNFGSGLWSLCESQMHDAFRTAKSAQSPCCQCATTVFFSQGVTKVL